MLSSLKFRVHRLKDCAEELREIFIEVWLNIPGARDIMHRQGMSLASQAL